MAVLIGLQRDAGLLDNQRTATHAVNNFEVYHELLFTGLKAKDAVEPLPKYETEDKILVVYAKLRARKLACLMETLFPNFASIKATLGSLITISRWIFTLIGDTIRANIMLLVFT